MRVVRLILIVWLGAVGTGRAQNAEPNDLKPERLEEFRKLTQQRVEDFQQYLSIIADKQASPQEKKEAIELTMELFIESAKIQVSGRDGKPKPPISIRMYLNKLSGLAQYTKVEITFYDVASVSKFEKGPDGDYHATATYFQQFKGFDAKGQLLYGDRSRKDIAVNGKTGNADKNKDDLKIFFGNVVVRETTPINGQ